MSTNLRSEQVQTTFYPRKHMYEVEAIRLAIFFPDHPPFSTLSSTIRRNVYSYVCDYEYIVNKE